MQELAESEVQIIEVDEGTENFNNPFTDAKAITAWNHRAAEVLAGTRVSPHARARAEKADVLAKRRARAKVARRSRKRNQH